MSKLTVRAVTLLFFAAVAVFPTIVQAMTSNKAGRKANTRAFRDTSVLMADGSDPVPNPIPWPKQPA